MIFISWYYFVQKIQNIGHEKDWHDHHSTYARENTKNLFDQQIEHQLLPETTQRNDDSGNQQNSLPTDSDDQRLEHNYC